MPETTPIEATRIGIPDQDRPDLFVPLWGSWQGNETLWQTLTYPQLSPGDCNDHCDPQLMFRIPGTRREKAGKALMRALGNWKTTRSCFPLHSQTSQAADAELLSALDALLALTTDAGVKP
jgi:hypothetical protein